MWVNSSSAPQDAQGEPLAFLCWGSLGSGAQEQYACVPCSPEPSTKGPDGSAHGLRKQNAWTCFLKWASLLLSQFMLPSQGFESRWLFGRWYQEAWLGCREQRKASNRYHCWQLGLHSTWDSLRDIVGHNLELTVSLRNWNWGSSSSDSLFLTGWSWGHVAVSQQDNPVIPASWICALLKSLSTLYPDCSVWPNRMWQSDGT